MKIASIMKIARYCRTLWANLGHPARMKTGPIHMQLEVTTHCNLQCVMCAHPALIEQPRHLPLEQFKTIFDRIRPLTISLSGLGEPFLHPEMAAMIRYAHERGARTITTSNLTVITPDLAREIVQSGLSLLKGSIDSTDPATYLAIRRRDLHHRVLEGLRHIQRAKQELGSRAPLVRLQFVMQGDNFREIPEVLDLCADHGVDAIYFQPIDLANEAYVDAATVERLIGNMDREAFKAVLEGAARKAEALKVATNLPTLFRDFESVWAKYRLESSPDPASAVCLMPWTSVYVSVDGDVRLCCSFAASQETTIGNLWRTDFMDIWNSPRYREYREAFRAGRRPHRICQNCIAPTLFRLVKSTNFFKYMLPR